MSDVPVPQPDNAVQEKELTPKELAHAYGLMHEWDNDPKTQVKTLGKLIKEARSLDTTTKEGKSRLKKIEKEIAENKMLKKVMTIQELDRQSLMSEQVSPRLRPLVVQFARDLSKEYEVKTPSEKAMVSMAAGAYGRWLELSSNFQSLDQISFLSHEKAHWYSIISKEVDRAFKQYQMSVTALKTMRNPLAGSTIKAKNAYIGQNQQFSTVPPQGAQATIVEAEPDTSEKSKEAPSA